MTRFSRFIFHFISQHQFAIHEVAIISLFCAWIHNIYSFFNASKTCSLQTRPIQTQLSQALSSHTCFASWDYSKTRVELTKFWFLKILINGFHFKLDYFVFDWKIKNEQRIALLRIHNWISYRLFIIPYLKNASSFIARNINRSVSFWIKLFYLFYDLSNELKETDSVIFRIE